MRVRGTRGNRSRATAPAAPWQTGRASATAFSAALSNSQLAAHNELLNELFIELDQAANGLSATTSLVEWEAFRALVLNYLNEVKAGYRLRKQAAWDPRGNQRLLVLIDAADQELVELGMAFIERQNDNFAFLNRVKRLKGLLLDMKS